MSRHEPDAGDLPTGAGEVLAHDGVTHVVRMGDTVRRPVRDFTATVHSYLRHLHDQGFHDAPVPLGLDDEGREVLSFVAGDVPVEPLPPLVADGDVMTALGRLLRRLHDASAGWVPPADAHWGSIPGARPAGVVPLFSEPELISHQDYCPGNVVFRDGLPAALIDFDLARPTTRVADVVNALHHWAPFTDPADRDPVLRHVDAGARARLLVDAYGMDAGQRAEIAATALRRARASLLTMRAAADVHPVFRRWWDEGLKDRLPRSIAWLEAEEERLTAALRLDA